METIPTEELEGNFREQGQPSSIHKRIESSADEAFAISAGNSYQNGTFRMLNACWFNTVVGES